MKAITVSRARVQWYQLLDQIAVSHEPIQINGRRSNAVLISEEGWQAVQETLYLLSIPGMRESIRDGLETPVAKCARLPKRRIRR